MTPRRRSPNARSAGSPAGRAPRLLEKVLQSTTIDMAHVFGLTVAHFRPAIDGFDRNGQPRWRTAVEADGAGFPDLIVVGPGGLLAREEKRDGENPTDAQQKWLDLLGLHIDAGVWREADLRSGRIEHELRALRTPRKDHP